MAVGKIMVENCIVYMWNIRFYRAELRNTRGNFNFFVFEYIYLKFIISIHLDILSSNIFTGSQISFHFPSRPLVSL